MVKAFVEVTSKPYFTYLDQLIKEAGGKHFVGNKVMVGNAFLILVVRHMLARSFFLH